MRSPAFVGRCFPGESLTVHFILESGHENSGDAERVFAELKQRAPEDVRGVLGTLAFGDKREYPGLQAADSMASIAFQADERGWDFTSGNPAVPTDYTLATFDHRRPMLKYTIDAGKLAEWRQKALAEPERRRAFWHSKRAQITGEA